MQDIKNYKPETNSISEGQVLHCPYNYEKTKLIVKEMIDNLSLNLVNKEKVTNQIVLTIGYDISNLTDPKIRQNYKGEITFDQYGRMIPKHSHGTINLDHKTSSSKILMQKTIELYERIINKNLLVKRINITASNIVDEKEINYEQLNIFTINNFNYENAKRNEELKLQKVMLELKNKYGKNIILKAMNLEEGATTKERNNQVGGHKE